MKELKTKICEEKYKTKEKKETGEKWRKIADEIKKV